MASDACKEATRRRKTARVKNERIAYQESLKCIIQKRLTSPLEERQEWDVFQSTISRFVIPDVDDIVPLDKAPEGIPPDELRDFKMKAKRDMTLGLLNYVWSSQGCHKDHFVDPRNYGRHTEDATESILKAWFDKRGFHEWMNQCDAVVKARMELRDIFGDPLIHFSDLLACPLELPEYDLTTVTELTTALTDNPLWREWEKKLQVMGKGIRGLLQEAKENKLSVNSSLIVQKYQELILVSSHRI